MEEQLDYAKKLLGALVRGTRMSNAVPLEVQTSALLTGIGNQLEGMMQGFMDQQQVAMPAPAKSGPTPRVIEIKDASDQFHAVVGLSDRLLEHVDTILDQHGQTPAASSGPSCRAGTPQRRQADDRPGNSLAADILTKPQLRWRDKIDNSPRPFVPKLHSKPNAVVPLELRLEYPDESAYFVSPLFAPTAIDRPVRSQPPAWYANPYVPEINHFSPSEVRSRPEPDPHQVGFCRDGAT